MLVRWGLGAGKNCGSVGEKRTGAKGRGAERKRFKRPVSGLGHIMEKKLGAKPEGAKNPKL